MHAVRHRSFRSAPDVDFAVKSREEVARILEGEQHICERIENDDVERWSLTRGGQFVVRSTGEDGDRFYVVPPADAWGELDGRCDGDVLAEVQATGAFGDVAPAHAP